MSFAYTATLKDAESKNVAYQKAHSLMDLPNYDASHATLPFDDLLDLVSEIVNGLPVTALTS